ncbi:hypothetical protein C427_2496 [Paraglaciecola psychrophila 170]|uniref:Uncharacterized protein n=1 Tax=Paraglaciecola psychrophila 170 TaxID=1129794 RepID=K7A459_9ALTE|nr:hypothetical protein C427_2496 [Paraglaciecola psychrophila 170]GAC37147.1 hypothetical protein GPSY_1514 [Paraglaciecola psychrophila 170]
MSSLADIERSGTEPTVTCPFLMALLYVTYNLGLGDVVLPKDFSDEK